MTLCELGEEKLLAQILPSLTKGAGVVPATGDDCAVVRFRAAKDYLLLKTDCVVENVHFRPAVSATAVGWKAMMRTLSDFAAMSGVPEFALITLIVPGDTKMQWVRNLYRGLNRAAARFQVAMVGGETSATVGSAAVIVSAAGRVEPKRCVLRRGGKANDDLFVTGVLGGSTRKRHLNFVPRITEARWLTQHFKINAMIDLSDGLGADLPRMAAASRLSFKLEKDSLPLSRGCSIEQAIADGEDYELLFAITREQRDKLERAWKKKFPRLALTRIGSFRSKIESRNSKLPSGYVHFQQRR